MNLFRYIARLRQSSEQGSALVELALSLPALCLMLLGAAEFARLAYGAIAVTNAAHTAAIYAASSHAALGDSSGISNAAVTDTPNLTGGNAVSVTSVTTACTCANSSYSPSSCADNATCWNNKTAMITAVTVSTQSTFTPMIRIPGGAMNFTLHGKSTQVVSNQ
jgi:Flp pilus assembly protein TadG